MTIIELVIVIVFFIGVFRILELGFKLCMDCCKSKPKKKKDDKSKQ